MITQHLKEGTRHCCVSGRCLSWKESGAHLGGQEMISSQGPMLSITDLLKDSSEGSGLRPWGSRIYFGDGQSYGIVSSSR